LLICFTSATPSSASQLGAETGFLVFEVGKGLGPEQAETPNAEHPTPNIELRVCVSAFGVRRSAFDV